MDPVTITLIVAASVGVLIAAGVGWVASHNRFVRQRHLIAESWRQVDVELRRRHDLIPRLLEVTRAAVALEQAMTVHMATQMAMQVMAARDRAVQDATYADPRRRAEVEGQLSSALRDFLAAVGQYPRLRASQMFVQLGQQLAETEDRIAAARRFYNGNVRAYNARIDSVPSNLVAGMAGFVPAQYFEVTDPAVRAAPHLEGLVAGPGLGQLTAPEGHSRRLME